MTAPPISAPVTLPDLLAQMATATAAAQAIVADDTAKTTADTQLQNELTAAMDAIAATNTELVTAQSSLATTTSQRDAAGGLLLAAAPAGSTMKWSNVPPYAKVVPPAVVVVPPTPPVVPPAPPSTSVGPGNLAQPANIGASIPAGLSVVLDEPWANLANWTESDYTGAAGKPFVANGWLVNVLQQGLAGGTAPARLTLKSGKIPAGKTIMALAFPVVLPKSFSLNGDSGFKAFFPVTVPGDTNDYIGFDHLDEFAGMQFNPNTNPWDLYTAGSIADGAVHIVTVILQQETVAGGPDGKVTLLLDGKVMGTKTGPLLRPGQPKGWGVDPYWEIDFGGGDKPVPFGEWVAVGRFIVAVG